MKVESVLQTRVRIFNNENDSLDTKTHSASFEFLSPWKPDKKRIIHQSEKVTIFAMVKCQHQH